MRSKRIIFGLLGIIAFSLFSNDSDARIWIDRSNGVFGHYKTVTEDEFDDNGETVNYLACADPGFKRCRFSALVSTGGEDVYEADLDEIYAHVDAEISSGNNTGGYLTLAGNLYATWTLNPTDNSIVIYSYQEAVDLGLI